MLVLSPTLSILFADDNTFANVGVITDILPMLVLSPTLSILFAGDNTCKGKIKHKKNATQIVWHFFYYS